MKSLRDRLGLSTFLLGLLLAWSCRAELPSEYSKQSATTCCLCVNKFSKDLELTSYFGAATCENRVGFQGECRKITILEKSCQRVRILRRGSALECRPNTITYVENGVRKHLPPMSPSPCEGRELAASSLAKEGGAQCICAADPEHSGSCVLSVVENGQTTKRISESCGDVSPCSCNPDVCRRIFAGRFDSVCPAYIQGGS